MSAPQGLSLRLGRLRVRPRIMVTMIRSTPLLTIDKKKTAGLTGPAVFSQFLRTSG